MVGDRPKLRSADAIRSIVFFSLLYLYLWLIVQPHLIRSCGTITNFPVFYKGWPFFWECMSYPGGLVRYLCALLPQFFYYSWAGALVITAQAWAISAGTDWLLGMLGVPGRRLLRVIPPLLVVATYARYSYHFPSLTGAVVSLLFACLYIGIVSRNTGIPSTGSGQALPVIRNSWAGRPCYCVAAYLSLSVILYVVGGAALLPFVALCLVYELLYRRRYGGAAACLLLGAAVPYVIGVLMFHASIVNAYTDTLPISWQIGDWITRRKMLAAVYALYLFPISMAVMWGLVRGIVAFWSLRRLPAKTRPARKKASASAARLSAWAYWLRVPAVRWSLESVFVLAVGGAVAFVVLDRAQKALLTVHYYACRHEWPQVLEASRRCPDNYTVMNAVNRALYHTNWLNRDMFRYLQHPDALVLTGGDQAVLYWHKFDTLIDLGLINLAEKNFTECMETFGAQPMILQRLALVNLIKGKVEAARIYLGALQETLFFSRWAKDYLLRLEADPTLATDSQLQQQRAQSLRKDSTAGFFAVEPMLLALVEQGPQNRMAYEYLMASCLMSKKLNRFAQNLGRLREFGYTEVPPLYQEAALIYARLQKKPVSPEIAIGPEVQQRIEQFTRVFYRKYGGDKDAAFRELAQEYWGSYFLYNIYGLAQAQK